MLLSWAHPTLEATVYCFVLQGTKKINWHAKLSNDLVVHLASLFPWSMETCWLNGWRATEHHSLSGKKNTAVSYTFKSIIPCNGNQAKGWPWWPRPGEKTSCLFVALNKQQALCHHVKTDGGVGACGSLPSLGLQDGEGACWQEKGVRTQTCICVSWRWEPPRGGWGTGQGMLSFKCWE